MVTTGSALALLKHRSWLIACGVFWVFGLLSGCGALRPLPDAQMALVTPAPLPLVALPPASDAEPRVHAARTGPPVQTPALVLYASPVTQAYWDKTEVDGRLNVQLWQVFLRKYKIPFQLITSVEQLEKTPVNALVLPSAVALSEREKKAIARFRAKGGGVLTSWMTGVRDERGRHIGFGFMEDTLDVKVAGDTENAAKDSFMFPHGDSPVTHHLPAGMRIWMDRVKGLYPLRLVGRNTAAHILDWSRKVALDKVSATVVFDERVESSGMRSRSVVLGYSEQLWVSADPKLLEAVTHNALLWVLRVPSAYAVAWPHPYRNALVTAVDVVGAVTDLDLENAKLLEQAGGRATYYVVNDTAAKSAERLKRLQASGHEIAYLGDKYTDFREQPAAVQAQRLDSMRKTMGQYGLAMTPESGFHPPMDSYDSNTEKLLRERDFGYVLSTMDASEARLPLLSTGRASAAATDLSKRMVVLPRTQEGPDELVDNCDPEIGLKPFFKEVQLSEQMAGLSVIPIPSRNELTDSQRADVFSYLGTRREHKWLATAGQVADWWRQRERVSVRLESVDLTLRLSITIKPGPPLTRVPAVWVNLPEMGSTLRLMAHGNPIATPRIVAVDAWRAAVLLDGLLPGEYHWNLRFDRPSSGVTGV